MVYMIGKIHEALERITTTLFVRHFKRQANILDKIAFRIFSPLEFLFRKIHYRMRRR